MTDTNPKRGTASLYSGGFLPVISVGFLDGFNPCMLTALIIFFLFLGVMGKTSRRMDVAGINFIAGFILANLTLLIGMADAFTATMSFQMTLYNVQLALGVGLIILGLISIYDWVTLRDGAGISQMILKFPAVFYRNAPGPDTVNMFVIAFIGLLTGAVTAVLASGWPANETIAAMYFDLRLPGKGLESFIKIALYSLFSAGPIIIAYIIMLTQVRSEGATLCTAKYASAIKIGQAALSIGLGIGLLYIFY